MTELKDGGAPTAADAPVSAKGVGDSTVQDPIISIEEPAFDIIEYRQTALSEFPPDEEWFEDNIRTMDQAEAFGRILIDVGEQIQLTLGRLFNHVETHKGGAGLKGGVNELSRRLRIPRRSATRFMSYEDGKQNYGQLGHSCEELPLSHYEAISTSSAPEKIVEFITETFEEKGKLPTIREVTRKNKEIVREKRLEDLIDLPVREDIIHDSIENILQYLEPESVDLIVTDPPYPEEFLPLWETLAQRAAIVLKPGGFLISYSAHIHLPRVLSSLSKHLKYVWIMVLLHSGPTRAVHPRRIHAHWKPILIYCKEPYTPQDEYVCDVIQGAGMEKDGHEWQQALGDAEELITRFSRPKDLVVDPFLGSGTTVLAARNTGRNFFGNDIDELAIKTTLGRLQDD